MICFLAHIFTSSKEGGGLLAEEKILSQGWVHLNGVIDVHQCGWVHMTEILYHSEIIAPNEEVVVAQKKVTHIWYTSYNLLLFVDQNNINKNILKRGNFAVVDFKHSIKQKRERGILIFSQKKNLTLFSNDQKKEEKTVIHNHVQSSLKGQIWKRNPVNCCSQRNFIYLNEKERRANLCVMYSNEAKQVVINPGFISTTIILPIWIIISYINVITPQI